jgi:hypothetical protein
LEAPGGIIVADGIGPEQQGGIVARSPVPFPRRLVESQGDHVQVESVRLGAARYTVGRIDWQVDVAGAGVPMRRGVHVATDRRARQGGENGVRAFLGVYHRREANESGAN